MSCTRASKFLDAKGIEVKETVPASRALGRSEAVALAGRATKVIVAKGKTVKEFKQTGKVTKELAGAMLGPTGNLRAPTIRKGSTLVVGFNEDVFEAVFG